METHITCIINTEDRWNTLCYLLDQRSFDWKSFASKVNLSHGIKGYHGHRVEDDTPSREYLFHWQNDSNATTSKLLEILRTENEHDAISLLQSWITEYDNLDPIVLYEQGMEYHWKRNFRAAIPRIEKAANNYPPACLRLAIFYYSKQDEVKSQKYKELGTSYKDWFMEQALTGDPRSQYHMGLFLEVIQKHTEAVEWYQKSAEQGYLPAQNSLAIFISSGKGVTKDRKQGIKRYQNAADKGFMMAQYNLAMCYKKGIGVPKDRMQAKCWFEKSAEQGNIKAQFQLGLLSAKEKNGEKAAYWYQMAAKQGDVASQVNLGRCFDDGTGVQKDEEKAVYWYHKAAQQGDTDAQFNLAISHEKGTGVEKDMVKAIYWYQKAAEQGHMDAQFELGQLFQTEGNMNNAACWFQKAADQGKSVAQYCLAFCFQNGTGVPVDPIKAACWFQKAAEQGHSGAQYSLAYYYDEGTGVAKDEKKATYWYHRAAEQGHISAQFNLFVENVNLGNTRKAAYWLQKAAEQEDNEAQLNLGLYFRRGVGVPQQFIGFRRQLRQETLKHKAILDGVIIMDME